MKLNLENFTAPDLDTWRSKIKAEQKSAKNLLYLNDIEDIEFDPSQKKMLFDFDTNDSKSTNDWGITAYRIVDNIQESNRFLLQCLKQGANELFLDMRMQDTDWSVLFNNIHLDYIHTSVCIQNAEQLNSLIAYLPEATQKHFSISLDPIHPIALDTVLDSKFSISISGFGLEQIGGKASDQISLLLCFGASIIDRLKDPERIQFELGIGSDFFVELAKIRALKWLWKHLLNENNIISSGTKVMARIGWTNKSLKDPDINILRQTTESISAVSGGASSILIHDSHIYSEENNSWFYQRLALNISHVLKEEAYLTKVNDPLKGAFVIEMLTECLVKKSWDSFLKSMNLGMQQYIETILKEEVQEIRNKKLKAFDGDKRQLIGINLFPKESDKKNTWKGIPKYLDFNYLIFEKHQDV